VTSIATVLAWDVDALDRAADALAAERSRLVGLQDELDDGAPPGTWSGPASGAARAAHGRLVNRLTGTVAEVSAVAAAVDAAAASLREATADLRSMLDWAQRNGYAVDRASGRVDDQGCHPDDVAADRALVATEYAERLRQALLTATHADAQLAGVLDRVASGALDAGGGSLDEAAAAGAADGALGVRPAPLDGSPAEANAWWESLTDDEQQQVLAEHPEWLGSTDGIPASVRDQANRALIGVYRAELEAEEARLRAALDGNLFGGLFTSDDAALEVVREKLAGLDRVEQVLKRGSRQLLVLDITGSRQLMAAVAVGDVDTADHVAVFTPGFTTTVAGSLTSYDSSMAELRAVARAEARKYGDGGTVATVSWLGYEAPQWDEWHDLGGRFVTSDSSAQAGAASLADFYRGIDASPRASPCSSRRAWTRRSCSAHRGSGPRTSRTSTCRAARSSGSRRGATSSRTSGTSAWTRPTSTGSPACRPARPSWTGRPTASRRGTASTSRRTRRASTTSRRWWLVRRTVWCWTPAAAPGTC
jgi:hypothetical protein